ncbi:consortin-like [Montipora capricornis]|uniref:consortin-like n=1 Tax=Montipora capricornis TaxID=246305 RepID=UPI0035F140DD
MQTGVLESPDEQVEAERAESNPDSLNPAEDDEGDQQITAELGKLHDEPLTDQERQLLFEKGIKFKKKGNYQHALYCLLACVRGLREGSDFPQLPECLHNIAEIYSQLEDYENAISFAQAEKLFYETSLISVGNEAQQEEGELGFKDGSGSSSGNFTSTEKKATQPKGKDDPQGNSTEARSANEYEKLAHMCLKQKNAQLALEYCGKAVKLRQSIYGEQHAITKRTLDLFTVIYAEMGKEQYSAAMQKFNEAKQSEDKVPEQSLKHPKSDLPVKEESEELPAEDSRQNPVGESQEGKEQNTAAPPVTDNDDRNDRMSLTSGQAMFCFFLLTVIVAVGVTLLCCRISGKDPVNTFKYMVTRIKFYYFYYMKRPNPGDRYF